jgi:hypothetical protein
MPIDDETLTKLLRVFERIYAERAVYQSIVQGIPGWKEEFDKWMTDPEYLQMAHDIFSTLRKQLDAGQPVEKTLRDLNKSRVH